MTPPVVEFDNILTGSFASYMELSAKIGGDVKSHAELVSKCFDETRNIVVRAATPDDSVKTSMSDLLKALSTHVGNVVSFKDSHRASKEYNHLSAVAEAIPAIGWVSVKPTPVPYIKDMMEAGQFYSNRVIKGFKDSNKTHVEWARAYMNIWTEMQVYVKSHHTTGLNDLSQKGSGKASGMGGPPGPPPPPPPVDLSDVSASNGDSGSRAALFSEINKGSNVTTGLRKVTDDMKTHKNPNLRQDGIVSSKGVPPPITHPKPGKTVTAAAVKPSLLELKGNKWCVENYVGNKEVTVEATEIKQTVYIYKCTDTCIQVKGKVNSIVLDSCKKVGILFEGIISCLDIVNCQSVQAQVKDRLPSVNIDKTDGFQLYLSEESKAAEIVSAKSSEMNVLIPVGDGDYNEYPIPEQFKTKFDGTKLKTQINDN